MRAKKLARRQALLYAARAITRARIYRGRLTAPPGVLTHGSDMNRELLRAFGAQVAERVLLRGPISFSGAELGYHNLVIHDGCVLNGNNYIDLVGRVTLEAGVSLGPGVIVMTHNRFNFNPFLEDVLAHQCGIRDVVIKAGAGIKAGAIITMGVTVGKNSVVAAGAVVNRDVPPYRLVGGVPAREILRLDERLPD